MKCLFVSTIQPFRATCEEMREISVKRVARRERPADTKILLKKLVGSRSVERLNSSVKPNVAAAPETNIFAMICFKINMTRPLQTYQFI